MKNDNCSFFHIQHENCYYLWLIGKLEIVICVFELKKNRGKNSINAVSNKLLIDQNAWGIHEHWTWNMNKWFNIHIKTHTLFYLNYHKKFIPTKIIASFGVTWNLKISLKYCYGPSEWLFLQLKFWEKLLFLSFRLILSSTIHTIRTKCINIYI